MNAIIIATCLKGYPLCKNQHTNGRSKLIETVS